MRQVHHQPLGGQARFVGAPAAAPARGRRAAGALLAAVLLLGGAGLGPRPAPALATEVSAPAWGARLERRLAQAGVPEGEIGLAVLTLERSPRLVFARGQSQPLVPASVAKVLTSAAVLDLLGPAHVFTTRVSARGRLEDGRLDGDLVLHGSGDPNLSGRLEGGAPTVVLDRLAAAVAAAGVRTVAGDLVLDDGPFDRDYLHPGWTDADKEKWYGAPIAGLCFNDGCLDLTVAPAAAAEQGARLLLPSTSGAWEVQNLAVTVDGTRNVVGAAWTSAGVLQVRGQVALRAAPYTFHVPVPDPLAFVGGALRQRLAAAGVEVRGRVRPAASAADRAPGRVLAQHGSSLADALPVVNRQSQNVHASLLFKAAGAALTGEGSWASGQQAVAEMLRRRQIDDAGTTQIVDGSGLARANRTTAATVALVLASFERDLLRGPLLHDSLAAPGEPGTLDDRLLNRFTKGRLRAKTGTLAQAGVHAMAGVIEPPKASKGGETSAPGLVFAVIVNRRTWKGDARSLIDDLVTLLAQP